MINSWMQRICNLVVNSGASVAQAISRAKRKAAGIRVSVEVNRFYKNGEIA